MFGLIVLNAAGGGQISVWFNRLNASGGGQINVWFNRVKRSREKGM